MTKTNQFGEVDHGCIADELAWNLALDDTTEQIGAFQVIRPGGGEGGGPRAVARTDRLGMYVRAFADGKGENGLHAHPNDAIWLVLEGTATFHGSNDMLLGALAAGESILVPANQSYRFTCTGQSLLGRVSVAAVEARSAG